MWLISLAVGDLIKKKQLYRDRWIIVRWYYILSRLYICNDVMRIANASLMLDLIANINGTEAYGFRQMHAHRK